MFIRHQEQAAKISRQFQGGVFPHLERGNFRLQQKDLRLKQRLASLRDRVPQIVDIRAGILKTARERQISRIEEERQEAKKDGQTKLSRSVLIPATISSAGDLEELIRSLQALKAELVVYSDIEVTIKIGS